MPWTRPPKLLASRLRRVERKVLRQTQGATGTAVRTMDTSLRQALHPAKTINRQDAIPGKPGRQTRNNLAKVDWHVNHGSDGGIIITASVVGHYTGARTAAILGAMAYLGRSKELERIGLWVKHKRRGQDGQLLRARNNTGPAIFIRFSDSPRLLAWAEQQSVGMQTHRHIIYLDRRILSALLMAPVLRKASPKLMRAWRRALKEGFLGT